MVLLYWSIGERIKRELIGEGRAAYGEQIVSALSRQLAAEYGRGFSRPNLFNMIKFAEVFPDRKIVEYLTELPPRELLEKKLHEAIRLARERLSRGLPED
jgi:hypothetical protein